MALRAQGGIIIISLELLISIHAAGCSQRREFHIYHSLPLREDTAAENGDNEMNMMNRE
jgi:hypothetical protein